MSYYYVFKNKLNGRPILKTIEQNDEQKTVCDVIHHVSFDANKSQPLLAFRENDPQIEELFPMFTKHGAEYFRANMNLSLMEFWQDDILPVLNGEKSVGLSDDQLEVYELFDQANDLVCNQYTYSYFSGSGIFLKHYLDRALDQFIADSQEELMTVIMSSYDVQRLGIEQS